ncbi:MAG: hypothetical protein B7X59_06255 [Polaromonas sp. 39-63-203]|nr:MAG: hypothetical protein B7X59_06255 [Polaromonas sp. 39-63-203]
MGNPSAKLGGHGRSAARASKRGGHGRSAGPPQARPAPSGGSALREARSVGATTLLRYDLP